MNLSYTMLSSYFSCPYSYKLRYIDRVQLIENSASAYGTAVHRTIKIGYDSQLSRDDWAKVFKKEWFAITSSNILQNGRHKGRMTPGQG